MTTALAFDLPRTLEATAPPEARGVQRDAVRLMVADAASDRITHAVFSELPDFLRPGDLVVVNVSATLPAAVSVTRADGTAARMHVATRAPRLDDRWRVVELRSADGSTPMRARAGETLTMPGHLGELELVAPYASGSRLMLARLGGPGTVEDLLRHHGDPIRYGYVPDRWPLSAYQNVYARIPGSAEMPSAGRPFTHRLISELATRGIPVAPITLHTGVSSPEHHEPPFPEEFDVPEATARLVDMTRAMGGRVIAVGTTVVRALETVADAAGAVTAGGGWTGLVIDPGRGIHAVDGLITGWHEPEASHLQMLAALGGEPLLDRCYREALCHGYLWHEFGDSHLILSPR
ncbi:MAG TPA: S-adenosylmethionine:tRNA ribosyltransferase-isomerase [Solirubrobacteraceae bacterium]